LFPLKETFIFVIKGMDDFRFRVDFLEDAKIFLDNLDGKSRDKILYNIWKARSTNDKEIFKKLHDEIWEFRTLYNKTYFRLFAFWDKENKNETIVISTNGLIKKTDKIPKSEIEKAEKLRERYFNQK
jgi:phage-related protein